MKTYLLFFILFAIGGCNTKGNLLVELEGTGTKSSTFFHLSGKEATITYEYKSTSDYFGSFQLFVLHKGDAIMSNKPIVNTSEYSLNSEIKIDEPEGDYYLNVIAMGAYSIKVFEKK